MAKYLIHACPQRMWYVSGYLIPSMTSQGIRFTDIDVYNDTDGEGCLESCMKAFEQLPDYEEGTWHLQDDVVISERFRLGTELYNSGIVCGHTWDRHDWNLRCTGVVKPEKMWFSFPCIRIPNYLAKACARFYRKVIQVEEQYEPWIKAKRYDDTVFSLFLTTRGTTERIINLAPNLVAHIDYLIGGTIANDKRVVNETEPYFDEPETMAKLKEWLSYQPERRCK